MYTLFMILFLAMILGGVYYYVLKPRGFRLPGRGSSNPDSKGGLCPFCSSDDVVFSTKRQLWSCHSCKEVFTKLKSPDKPVEATKEIRK